MLCLELSIGGRRAGGGGARNIPAEATAQAADYAHQFLRLRGVAC
jgi:hypothetical protein